MDNWRMSAGLLGLTASLASANSLAEGLRCGDKLASTGSSTYEVRATCGEPDHAQHSVESRTVERRGKTPCPPGSLRARCETIISQTIQVDVDRWTYDFGSNRFLEFA